MSKQKPSGDMHCHSTLVAFNKKKNDFWYHKPPSIKQRRKGRFFRDNVGRPYTQSDFVSLAKGEVKVACVALGPTEWGFLTLSRQSISDQDIFMVMVKILRLVLRDILQFLIKYTPLGTYLSTYPMRRIREILHPNRDHFEELKKEYKKLKNVPVCPDDIADKHGIPCGTRIEIVCNYKEIEKILTCPNQKNVIAVIPTIEGAHSLGCGQKNTLVGMPITQLKAKLIRNIKTLKKWDHVPFFIGLDHHFWNQLAGHSMSFATITNFLFDQERGMNTGVNDLGKVVIRELLSTENGKRILIDTKHMSIKTRIWYYKLIEQYNDNKPDKKKIPVIVSHTGVNGLETMKLSQNSDDHKKEDQKYRLSDSLFNVWDINLTDEEIKIIHNSNGIIGLELDQRLLGGQMVNDFLNNLFRRTNRNIRLLRKLWIIPLLNNILHIAETIQNHTQGSLAQDKTIWDNIMLGSDLDGRINPIDPYCNSEDFLCLRTELTKMMIKKRDWDKHRLLVHKTEAQIKAIVDKIMFGNMKQFLETYFNDTYLNNVLCVQSVF